MPQYYVLLKASEGYEPPILLPYRKKAPSAEVAMEMAKQDARTYYHGYKKIEVLTIELERRDKK